MISVVVNSTEKASSNSAIKFILFTLSQLGVSSAEVLSSRDDESTLKTFENIWIRLSDICHHIFESHWPLYILKHSEISGQTIFHGSFAFDPWAPLSRPLHLAQCNRGCSAWHWHTRGHSRFLSSVRSPAPIRPMRSSPRCNVFTG